MGGLSFSFSHLKIIIDAPGPEFPTDDSGNGSDVDIFKSKEIQ